ncbi:MAG: hypothetical protein AAFQ51_04040 [Pseudomonadota bacterium]
MIYGLNWFRTYAQTNPIIFWAIVIALFGAAVALWIAGFAWYVLVPAWTS